MRPMAGWGALFVRGGLLVVLGLLAFTMPRPTAGALLALFAVVVIADGVLAMVAGFVAPGKPQWFVGSAGVVGVVIGVFTLMSPATTAVALVVLVGAWAFVVGVGQLATGVQMRGTADGQWLYMLSGIVSIVFGGYVIVNPGAGMLGLLWLFGFYTMFAGVMHLYIGLMMRRRMAKTDPAEPAQPMPA